jgi:hypothetical protein
LQVGHAFASSYPHSQSNEQLKGGQGLQAQTGHPVSSTSRPYSHVSLSAAEGEGEFVSFPGANVVGGNVVELVSFSGANVVGGNVVELVAFPGGNVASGNVVELVAFPGGSVELVAFPEPTLNRQLTSRGHRACLHLQIGQLLESVSKPLRQARAHITRGHVSHSHDGHPRLSLFGREQFVVQLRAEQTVFLQLNGSQPQKPLGSRVQGPICPPKAPPGHRNIDRGRSVHSLG